MHIHINLFIHPVMHALHLTPTHPFNERLQFAYVNVKLMEACHRSLSMLLTICWMKLTFYLSLLMVSLLQHQNLLTTVNRGVALTTVTSHPYSPIGVHLKLIHTHLVYKLQYQPAHCSIITVLVREYSSYRTQPFHGHTTSVVLFSMMRFTQPLRI